MTFQGQTKLCALGNLKRAGGVICKGRGMEGRKSEEKKRKKVYSGCYTTAHVARMRCGMACGSGSKRSETTPFEGVCYQGSSIGSKKIK